MRDYTPSDLCDELGPDAESQWLDKPRGYDSCWRIGHLMSDGPPITVHPGYVDRSPLYRKHHRCGLCLAAIAFVLVVGCVMVALGIA